MSCLLVRPARSPDEGPLGYRFRLARANLLSLSELARLGPLDDEEHLFPPADDVVLGGQQNTRAWVVRSARFCPDCLAARGHWHMGWEIQFADACAICGRWLVDSCTRCNVRLDWKREELLNCQCGSSLLDETGRYAPEAIVLLSRALCALASSTKATALELVQHMRLEQVVDLVRLIGAYGTWDGQRLPQKIDCIDRLEVSWSLVSVAAEVFSSWPTGFHRLLDRLQQRSSHHDAHRRLDAVFGGLYAALYGPFAAPEFDFVRHAFEDHVARNWTGAFARRNKRLTDAVLENMSWIPIGHAHKLIGISPATIRDCVAEGVVRAEARETAKGRTFTVVNKADVLAFASSMPSNVTIGSAAESLRLKKSRLLKILPAICPEARQRACKGSPWLIPKTWIVDWSRKLDDLLSMAQTGPNNVNFQRVVRDWGWADAEIAGALCAVFAGELRPAGRVAGAFGLGCMVFGVAELKQWYEQHFRDDLPGFSIPALADHLRVKEEVAYALVRSGFITSYCRRVGRRSQRFVTTESVWAFNRSYVLGRDVAAALGRSPRATVAYLKGLGVSPVAGPEVNGCRQAIFDCEAVAAAFRRFDA